MKRGANTLPISNKTCRSSLMITCPSGTTAPCPNARENGSLFLTISLDSGGNWSKASDRRLKRDVQDVSHMLEKLLALQPVEFYYHNQDLETMPHKGLGFIAQDVEP